MQPVAFVVMELSNAKIDWIAWIISNQFGCLKDFCIDWEKGQINKLVVPPLSKLAAFVL
jgi:sporulation protein YlmC with PRC-barrel domain